MSEFLANFSKLPIVAPFIALLHSRKFVVAVVTAGAHLFMVSHPELAGYATTLTPVITLLALMVIGGISFEDAANASAEAKNITLEQALDEIKADAKDAALAAVEEVFKSSQAQ
jgi:hypothetical protein